MICIQPVYRRLPGYRGDVCTQAIYIKLDVSIPNPKYQSSENVNSDKLSRFIYFCTYKIQHSLTYRIYLSLSIYMEKNYFTYKLSIHLLAVYSCAFPIPKAISI